MGVKWYGPQVKAAMRKGTEEAVTEVGQMVYDASQKRVPEDTELLRQSGKLDVNTGKLRATISYGAGLPDPRAVITHEKLEIPHATGTAKFLESPMRELLDDARGVFAHKIHKHLE